MSIAQSPEQLRLWTDSKSLSPEIIAGMDRVIKEAIASACSSALADRNSAYAKAETWYPENLAFIKQAVAAYLEEQLIDDPGLLKEAKKLVLGKAYYFIKTDIDLSTVINPDWKEIYKTFSGRMRACLGKNCPASCCGIKMTSPFGGSNSDYNFTFWDESELAYQQSLPRSLEDCGVEVEIFESKHGDALLGRNCSDRNGLCKLTGRKPLICRIFPINLGDFCPVETGCPSIDQILANETLYTKIRLVRKMLGLWTDTDWLMHFDTFVIDAMEQLTVNKYGPQDRKNRYWTEL